MNVVESHAIISRKGALPRAGAASLSAFPATGAARCRRTASCATSTGERAPTCLRLLPSAMQLLLICGTLRSANWQHRKAQCLYIALNSLFRSCCARYLRSIAETGRAPRLASDPAPSVALWAEHSPHTASLWPHRFEAMYTVREEHDFKKVHDYPSGRATAWGCRAPSLAAGPG